MVKLRESWDLETEAGRNVRKQARGTHMGLANLRLEEGDCSKPGTAGWS